MKNKLCNILNLFVFLLIASVLVASISYISIPTELMKNQSALYRTTEDDSIDIVFVGSSATRRFYDVMAIWDEYEITSMLYSFVSMPFSFTVPMMELALEQQDPELYVVELRQLIKDETNMNNYGYYNYVSQKEASIDGLNLFPYSFNRITAILDNDLFSGERYLYLLEVLYNHEAFYSGWELLLDGASINDTSDYRGNVVVFQVADVSEYYVEYTSESSKDYTLTESTLEQLEEVFTFSEENDLEVCFNISPYIYEVGPYDQEIRRELEAVITANGYEFFDYRDQIEEIGLDLETDYYDDAHVNALGAEKYTIYAIEDIISTYDITGEYEKDVTDSWNETYAAWEIYYEEQITKIKVN